MNSGLKASIILPDADEVAVIRRELVRSEAIYQQDNILCSPLRRPAWLAS
jgi:hypothetical protein